MSGTDGAKSGDAPPTSTSTAERLIESARSLLTNATLDDLAEFVTVRRLIDSTDLSSGAVYSSFTPEAGIGARQRSAAQVATREAFRSLRAEYDESVVDLVRVLVDSAAERSEGSADFQFPLAEILAAYTVAVARGEAGDQGWSYTHLFLGAAVSLNDPEVAAFLSDAFLRYEQMYAPALEELMRLTGRVLIDGVDLHQISRMLISVGDACALRVRVDPDADHRMLASMFVAVWVAMTRRADDRDDQLGPRLAIHGRSPLTAEEVERVRAAVLRVWGRAGWPAVTLAKVAQLSGVSDAQLAGQYPSRHELAPFVWDSVVDHIARRDEARQGLSPGQRLVELVDDLCDTTCAQRALTASLLIAHLGTVHVEPSEAADPGSERIVEHLASTIRSAVDAVDAVAVDMSRRPTLPAAGDGFRVMARATLDLVLLRAARSTMSGTEVAAMIVDGMAGSGIPIADADRTADGSDR